MASRAAIPTAKTIKARSTIEKDGDDYHVSWKVGDSAYEGTGKLEDNLLTVDWGSTTPVVYALADDGSLKGLWDAGLGEETLTPDNEDNRTAHAIRSDRHRHRARRLCLRHPRGATWE